ncbi:MAG: hypothetical protein WD768_23030 [Phycisphaeraceae bacterium]
MFRSIQVVSASLLLAFIITPLLAQEDKPADLPVTKAVLFSSGVGYFEHSGTVEGDSIARLMFKSEQINDILKSMVLMDLDGGTITTVAYASKEPVERVLRSFGVDISDAPTLPELLAQLRGAEINVDGIVGKILSVEKEEKVVGEPPTKVTEHIIRIVTAKGIQSVKMSSMQSLTLTDPKMQNELNEALTLLIGARDQDRKAVDVRFTGKGKRRVRIGYLVESPVWKTSYRLDLSAEKPLLQGWAIVENVSENDWKNISMSLVSGRPISFIQDLYTPLFVDRPVVETERYASLRPRLYEEGIEANRKGKALAEANEKMDGFARSRAMAPAAKSAESARFAGAPAADADARFDLGGSVQSVVSGGSVGELFQFTIHHPVNMQRHRAAMLPIVNQAVKAEKISIYNQAQHATHPLNGVYLINDTGMKLPAGPVTVFDGSTYAGDARLDHLAVDEKRLLSYAMDLTVTIDPCNSSSQKITSARLVRGVLYVNRMQTYTQTYKVKSKADGKKTLIIEHPFVNGRNLTQPKSFEEKTPQVYRFRVPIDGKDVGDFVVEEQQPATQSITIMNAHPNTYLGYMTEGAISDKIKAALQKAATLQQELNELQAHVNRLQQEKRLIEQGQDRLRKNIETVGRDSTLGKRYLEKLTEEENQIEKLEADIVSTQKKVDAKRDELANYVNSLDLN